MVTQSEYKKKTKKFWNGKKVRLLSDITTGVMLIPKGKICTINDKLSGFGLISDPCDCCGVRVFVHKVPPSWVELVE